MPREMRMSRAVSSVRSHWAASLRAVARCGFGGLIGDVGPELDVDRLLHASALLRGRFEGGLFLVY